jgi:hypothetical protein
MWYSKRRLIAFGVGHIESKNNLQAQPKHDGRTRLEDFI